MHALSERFDEFLRRMLAAPGCSSFAAAFDLLAQTLNQVEDELSGKPYDPTYPRDDRRMYPPKDDAYRPILGRQDLRRYRSRQHNTYFSDSGAILIVDLQMNVVLDKPDLNARSIKL